MVVVVVDEEGRRILDLYKIGIIQINPCPFIV